MSVSKTFDKAANGTSPVLIGQHDTGLDLAGWAGNMQLSCSGLDGGTYGVQAMVPGNPNWLTVVAPGVSATAAPTAFQWPAIMNLLITFAGCGGSAAPVVHLTQRGRNAAFGSGA